MVRSAAVLGGLLALTTTMPTLAGDAAGPEPAPSLLRLVRSASPPAEYEVRWSAEIGAPIGDSSTIEGRGRLLVALEGASGDAVSIRVAPVGFCVTLAGETVAGSDARDPFIVTLDRLARVLAIEGGAGADPMGATALQLLLASSLPESPALPGAQWWDPVPRADDLLEGYERPTLPAPRHLRPRGGVDRTRPIFAPPPERWGARQALAGLDPEADAGAYAVYTKTLVRVDLSAVPLGTGGDALVRVFLERDRDSGWPRTVTAFGSGRVRALVLPSLPLDHLTVTVSRVGLDGPLEPLAEYEEPALDDPEPVAEPEATG